MKKMAARTPAKEGEVKEEKPETPATRKRRVRRRLFETPTKESPAAKSEASNGEDDSGEDGDLFGGKFRLKDSSSLPEKRDALNRVPSRTKNKRRRRAGSSPGLNTASKASEAPEDMDREDDDAPASAVKPKKEQAEQARKPAAAPPSEEAPQSAKEVESEVLQSLPKGLSE